ncbi:hypothetical protein B296_00023395 [Ensete ventricosum]|uniref:Uncharacterized protein n=1 Tax=Ensete ventricosum TaxID=4639 RepID=A0A426X6T9_ENSVE|nr:hypothetical protein B296_00023395 [Ensete ventricosum]
MRSTREVRTRSGGVKIERRQLLPRGLLQAATVLDDEVGEGGQDQKRRSQGWREATSSVRALFLPLLLDISWYSSKKFDCYRPIHSRIGQSVYRSVGKLIRTVHTVRY